ncbi:hypothetical protein [Haladaptatus halobius]|uniref:hypothetical protein n=1 Tax=Haladaptatus halobius TaxID=2884875 RepID=UPI001D0A87A8|nr:hypothetical protein [Haladaptatus halobius]
MELVHGRDVVPSQRIGVGSRRMKRVDDTLAEIRNPVVVLDGLSVGRFESLVATASHGRRYGAGGVDVIS